MSESGRSFVIWVVAAVAVVVLVGVPLLLLRGDGDSDDGTTTTLAGPSTTAQSTTTVQDPGTTSTSDAGSTVVPPTTGDCAQDYENLGERNPDAWYVFYACDRAGLEEMLVPVEMGMRSEVSNDIQTAMLAQLAGPSPRLKDAGYTSFAVQDGGQVLERYSGPTDSVFDFGDFSTDSGMSNASASSASAQLLAQLSSAAFQFPVETVSFTFSGDCDAFWNWLQRDCTTLARIEWEAGEITSSVAAWWETAFETPTTTEPPDATGTTVLPGEPFDIGPAEGDVVAVVGVRYDDVLNLRAGPGVGYEPLAGLEPLEVNVVATGRHRLLEDSIWNEVAVAGVTGWVNSRFLGYLGGVDDLTALVVTAVGEDVVAAETMVDLAEVIVASFKPEESGFRSEISVAPTVGDLGEITVDVLGLADDALLGYRLHIFGQPAAGGEGFELKSIEATSICGRGVTADGLCV